MPVSLQENCAILKELVSLRAQKSSLLGFHTHADYVLEMNMAKTSQTVATFLGSHSPLAMGAHLCLEGRCHDRLWGSVYSRARLLPQALAPAVQLGVYPGLLGFWVVMQIDLILHVGGSCPLSWAAGLSEGDSGG